MDKGCSFGKYTFLVSILVLINFVSIPNIRAQDITKYDVVVYGGTSAGVMSAVEAARMGESVLLISPKEHLGGVTSSGLGMTDMGNGRMISGIAREFYKYVYDYYKNPKAWKQQKRSDYVKKVAHGSHRISVDNGLMWTEEPHVAEQIFDDFVESVHVVVRLGQKLNRKNGVEIEDGHIKAITMLNGDKYRGKVFIDATYVGDLMAAAGVSYTVGREANGKYGETLDGIEIRYAWSHQFPRGVSPYVIADDPSSGLLPYINPKIDGIDGTGDKKVQAYNYRICLTDAPRNRLPITKPAHYDPKRYELLLRLIKAQPKKRALYDYFKWDPMPNRKTDINNSGAFSTDLIGMVDDFPEASYQERAKLIKKYKSWTKGLLYFWGHDPRVPKNMRKQMLKWGYPKDEFQDTNHWPYQLYIREGRRMVSNYVITQHQVTGDKSVPEPIAVGYYNMDSHHTQRYVTSEGYVQNEGDVEVYPGGPWSISYKAIIPRAEECTNLLVPVCLSASHIAYGSIRMEPVFMELGQASGAAATLAVQEGTSVQKINYHRLKKRLLKDGMILKFR